MATQLAAAHILAQERLRGIISRAVTAAWIALPGYDERNVDEFTTVAGAAVLAGQRQAVALTEAFLAAATGRPALGLDPADMMGAAVRAGAAPEDVYRRPFVTVWTALKDGRPYEDAVRAGQARAASTAATDAQLSMRATLRAVGEADDRIVGYQRVPDGGACSFCLLVAGQRYRTDQLMPIHNHCGCGVDVITAASRHAFTGNRDNDLNVTRDGVTAEVREHGELGPVLTDGSHHFEVL